MDIGQLPPAPSLCRSLAGGSPVHQHGSRSRPSLWTLLVERSPDAQQLLRDCPPSPGRRSAFRTRLASVTAPLVWQFAPVASVLSRPTGTFGLRSGTAAEHPVQIAFARPNLGALLTEPYDWDLVVFYHSINRGARKPLTADELAIEVIGHRLSASEQPVIRMSLHGSRSFRI